MVHKKRIGVVIVSYGHNKYIPKLIDSIMPGIRPGDKLIVVDNKNPHNLAFSFKRKGLSIVDHDNGGFAAGCNFGASKIVNDVDILVFINPDTYAENNSDYLDKMRNGYLKYDAWQSLVLLPDKSINSAGNVLHITGLSWTNKFGTKEYPESEQKIDILSGAALAITKKYWLKVNGFTEDYFLYIEDVDLSLKIRAAGGRIGILPQANIIHDFDFEKGNTKWFYIERNRLICMLALWPSSLLFITFVPNIIFNLIIFLKYLLAGRPQVKIHADLDFIRMIPTALRLRKNYRNSNLIMEPRKFVKTLVYKFDSPLLGPLANNKFIDLLFKIYYKVIHDFIFLIIK
ncbi:MAG: hypothetical protein NTV95_01520 [Candidatus Saccharibacteria bacterium]|nr:hypothetical protein [Candidatus Saccharibacteria bacterium]